MKKIILLLLTACCLLHTAWSQSWHSVGIMCPASVNFLKVYKGFLYADDISFTNPCWNYFGSMAKFNGFYWDTTGMCDRVGAVGDIEEYNGEVYCGCTTVLSGNPWPNNFLPNAQGLAKWNGSQWMAVDSPAPGGGILALKYRNDLYMGGSITTIAGVSCKKIIKYNGSTWNNMQGGIDGGFFPNVYSMAVYNGDLYVAGQFDIAGTVPCNNIARWDGTKWDSVGGGVNAIVWSMLVDTINNYLYVGGNMTSAGGIPVWCIARWDGVKWDSVGIGIVGGIHAMTMLNGDLYVGGNIGSASYSDTVLGKWDGIKWTPIVGLNNGIDALAAYKGNIYAGGPFTHYGDSVNGATLTNGLACYGNTCPQGVGIQEFNVQGLKFKVYPNPARAEINIDVEEKENKEYIAKVYNSVGAKIIEQKFTKQTKISTANFSKGIYQVQVCNKDGKICHTEKVLIE